MQEITLVSFIRNEEKNIDAWLSHIKPHVKDIILFDLESDDNTYDLCKKYTDKVYKRPFLLCGDFYKQELAYLSKTDWLLWAYPDERFPEVTLAAMNKLINSESSHFTAFCFMRHEYLNDIRLQFNHNDKIIAHGTSEAPNYQNRLHRNDGNIIYTELVHFEIFGQYKNCGLPPELYFEHRKSQSDQDFDNVRTYIWLRSLLWKYQNTPVEPFKTYCDSYRKIVRDSQNLNLSGERKLHLAEELWYDWPSFINTNRITLEEFEKIMGISYANFIGKEK